MITLRLHRDARALLDEVAERTDRPLGWILGEATITAMVAVAGAADIEAARAVLAPHLPSPDKTHTSRMTTTLSKHCESVVGLLLTHQGGGLASTSAIVRAAWGHWISTATVDEIAEHLGVVRPRAQIAMGTGAA